MIHTVASNCIYPYWKPDGSFRPFWPSPPVPGSLKEGNGSGPIEVSPPLRSHTPVAQPCDMRIHHGHEVAWQSAGGSTHSLPSKNDQAERPQSAPATGSPNLERQ